jgi:hypothetical protein
VSWACLRERASELVAPTPHAVAAPAVKDNFHRRCKYVRVRQVFAMNSLHRCFRLISSVTFGVGRWIRPEQRVTTIVTFGAPSGISSDGDATDRPRPGAADVFRGARFTVASQYQHAPRSPRRLARCMKQASASARPPGGTSRNEHVTLHVAGVRRDDEPQPRRCLRCNGNGMRQGHRLYLALELNSIDRE